MVFKEDYGAATEEWEMNKHIINHIENHHLRRDNTIHIIGVVTNHQRWNSRLRLARHWIQHMLETPNVKLHIIEATHKNHCPELAPKNCEYDYVNLQVSTHAWLKESLINYGCHRAIHRDGAKYLGHIDMDVFFENQQTWAQAALHELQVHPFMQPWSHAVDLGPHNQILLAPESFGSVQQTGKPLKIEKCIGYSYPHPGYAWCYTSKFFLGLPGRGLLDFCVVGNADWHMAWAAIGMGRKTLRHEYSNEYKHRVLEWGRIASRMTHGQIGYIEGFIKHPFHGSKENRFYISRAHILTKNKYCPSEHIRYDDNGIIHLVNNPGLEHDIMKYGRSRKEDSTEV